MCVVGVTGCLEPIRDRADVFAPYLRVYLSRERLETRTVSYLLPEFYVVSRLRYDHAGDDGADWADGFENENVAGVRAAP